MTQELLLPRQLTEEELMQGQILTPAQELYFKAIYTEMTLAAAEVDLVSNTVEQRHHLEMCRAFDGGKRAFIAELLLDSESAKATLREMAANQNQPG